jgi:hypothetical protein
LDFIFLNCKFKRKNVFFWFKNRQTFKTIVLIIGRAILGGSFAVGAIENPSQGLERPSSKGFWKNAIRNVTLHIKVVFKWVPN